MSLSLKHLTIGAVMAIFSFAVQAPAQKNELSGMIGRSFISDQRIQGAPTYDPDLRFGNGLTFEVNYARQIRTLGRNFFSLALELPFVVNLDEDLHAALPIRIPEQYASYFVTPSARINLFAGQGISPWVSLGGGFGHFAASSTLLFGGPNTEATGTTTGALQAGLGLDVAIFTHFGLRAEGRDFWSGMPQLNVNTGKNHQNNIFAGAGVVWHF